MKGKLFPCWFIGASILVLDIKSPPSRCVLGDSRSGTVAQFYISKVLFWCCLLSDNLNSSKKLFLWWCPWHCKECITFTLRTSPHSLTLSFQMKCLKPKAPCGSIRHCQPLLCRLSSTVHAQAEIELLPIILIILFLRRFSRKHIWLAVKERSISFFSKSEVLSCWHHIPAFSKLSQCYIKAKHSQFSISYIQHSCKCSVRIVSQCFQMHWNFPADPLHSFLNS